MSEPPAREPRVSVVVATRDRSERLAALLGSLRAQTLAPGDFEVVVVDDASRDSTAAVLAREAERGGLELRTLRRERSGGPGGARNDGWRAARAPLVAFTDDDCVVDPRWLEAGLAASAALPGAVVQGRTDPIPEETAGAGPFTRTVAAHGDGPYYQTCNVFYPRALLERLGGFDSELYPRSGEDTDLAWRARAAGAPTAYAADARAFHAVNRLGPMGKLRVAARWGDSMRVYVRFPELRARVFTHGLFWKSSHYLLVRALLTLLLPRRLWVLRRMLAAKYMTHVLIDRGRLEGGGPLYAPWFVLHDAVELLAVARAAIRLRRPML